jgi:outer membrane protein OmpA-like peptidoglycan-associated protein
MITFFRLSSAVTVVALASACSSVPVAHAPLERVKADLLQTQSDPRAQPLAATEVRRAQEAVWAADAAWQQMEPAVTIDHLVHLASTQVSLANEAMALRSSQAVVGSAGSTRAAIRLDARTQEADAAHRQAQQARMDTQSAQRTADVAQAQMQTARQQAESARMQNKALIERLGELNAKPAPQGVIMTLGDVLFDTDRSALKPTGLRLIQQLALVLRDHPERDVLIEGFTDSTGSEDHNRTLSLQRANAVRSALLTEGVTGQRIAIRGHGEGSPVSNNDTSSGRQLNRRVEILVSDGQGFTVVR